MPSPLPDWASSKEKVLERLFTTQMLITAETSAIPASILVNLQTRFQEGMGQYDYMKDPAFAPLVTQYGQDCMHTFYMRYLMRQQVIKTADDIKKKIQGDADLRNLYGAFSGSIKKEFRYADLVVTVLKAHYTRDFFLTLRERVGGDNAEAIKRLGSAIRHCLLAFRSVTDTTSYGVEPRIRELLKQKPPNYIETAAVQIENVVTDEAKRVTTADYPWLYAYKRLGYAFASHMLVPSDAQVESWINGIKPLHRFDNEMPCKALDASQLATDISSPAKVLEKLFNTQSLVTEEDIAVFEREVRPSQAAHFKTLLQSRSSKDVYTQEHVDNALRALYLMGAIALRLRQRCDWLEVFDRAQGAKKQAYMDYVHKEALYAQQWMAVLHAFYYHGFLYDVAQACDCHWPHMQPRIHNFTQAAKQAVLDSLPGSAKEGIIAVNAFKPARIDELLAEPERVITEAAAKAREETCPWLAMYQEFGLLNSA